MNRNFHNMFDTKKFSFQYMSKYDNNYDIYKLIMSDSILKNNGFKNYHNYHNNEIKISNKCKKYFEKS